MDSVYNFFNENKCHDTWFLHVQESDDDGLSDYEKMRLENIRRNQAFFDGLNLTQVQTNTLNTNYKKTW